MTVIKQMIDQVISAHPDIAWFHIGADEVCLTSDFYMQTTVIIRLKLLYVELCRNRCQSDW